jgi:hypothetical protein
MPETTRRPTLEVHVPASPTPSFLNMVHYQARSLRARGGVYRDAPIVLTLGAESHDPNLELDTPWLGALGVEIRWIPEQLFARESWYATACERLRYDFASDVILLLDADALIAGPLDELVELAHRTDSLCGVVAHIPPLASSAEWQRIYDSLQLGRLETPCQHTGWGYMFQDESLRYCPPYFNLGVLAVPAGVARRIGAQIYDLMAAVDAVRRTDFRVQLGVSLAVTRSRLSYHELPLRWNFVNDPLLEAIHGSELAHLRIIHLLRKHQLDKHQVFASLDSVEALLGRRDLRVTNAVAQELLRELHPHVIADRRSPGGR